MLVGTSLVILVRSGITLASTTTDRCHRRWRIAEIVVLCERRAGRLLARYAASSSSGTSKKNSTDEDGGDGITKEEKEKLNEDEEEDMMDYEAAALPYIAPFELFCERTILAKIVTLVTGIEQRRTRQQRFDSVATATANAASYRLAAAVAVAAATANIATSKKGGGERRLQQQQQQQQQQSSLEISELITHFVSFLKSLALRLNPETGTILVH